MPSGEWPWSAPAPLTITGVAGGCNSGQAIDLVLVVMNHQGMDIYSPASSRSARMHPPLGPCRRDAAADTDWKMKAEMLTYSAHVDFSRA